MKNIVRVKKMRINDYMKQKKNIVRYKKRRGRDYMKQKKQRKKTS